MHGCKLRFENTLNGGACALGHPSAGVRRSPGWYHGAQAAPPRGRYRLATICGGVGLGAATILEATLSEAGGWISSGSRSSRRSERSAASGPTRSARGSCAPSSTPPPTRRWPAAPSAGCSSSSGTRRCARRSAAATAPPGTPASITPGPRMRTVTWHPPALRRHDAGRWRAQAPAHPLRRRRGGGLAGVGARPVASRGRRLRRQSITRLRLRTTLPAAAMIAVAGVTLVAARVAIEIIELEVHAAPVAQAQPGITDTLPADAGLLGGADFVASPAVVAVGVSVGALPIAHALVPARGTAALAALTHASRETLVAARTAVLRVAGLVDTLTVADLVSDRARAITPCADLASRAGDAALAAVARVTEFVDALPTTDYLPRRARAHALHAALSGEALVAARAAVGVVAIEIGALAAALVLPGGALADAGHTERPRHTRVRAAAAAAVVRVG